MKRSRVFPREVLESLKMVRSLEMGGFLEAVEFRFLEKGPLLGLEENLPCGFDVWFLDLGEEELGVGER